MTCECGIPFPTVAGQLNYRCLCGRMHLIQAPWPTSEPTSISELVDAERKHWRQYFVPDYVTTKGSHWTWRRWLCLHFKWERLGYCEYGTAGGYAWVALRCVRCGATRIMEERV